MIEYLEIEQDPDQSDSDMMEVIREKLLEGWSLSDHKYNKKTKINTWVFEKESKLQFFKDKELTCIDIYLPDSQAVDDK